MAVTALIGALLVASVALVLAHNAVLAWLAARAAAEERREVHYHQLVDISMRAMNTAREEILAAWERQERHLESVLESFLSRSFEERQMGRMIANEVRVDQDVEPLDIHEDDLEALAQLRRARPPKAAGANPAEVATELDALERTVRERGGLERSSVGVETE